MHDWDPEGKGAREFFLLRQTMLWRAHLAPSPWCGGHTHFSSWRGWTPLSMKCQFSRLRVSLCSITAGAVPCVNIMICTFFDSSVTELVLLNLTVALI